MDSVNTFLSGFKTITTPYDKVDHKARNIQNIINLIGGSGDGGKETEAQTPANGPPATTPANGAPEIRVRRTSSRPLRGPSVMRVGIDIGGQTQRKMSVTADVRIWRPVVVASHMIRRGEEMALVGCELSERDVTQVRGAYFSDMLSLEGMQARRTLSIGDIITDGHVEKVPVVRRGDAIRLVARAGRMSMSASGEAMQDGGIGDRIRVKNSDSGKVVYGHVLEDGAIQVGL